MPTIKDRRTALQMSREALAYRAGVSAATIYRIEAGKVTGSNLALTAIERALDEIETAATDAARGTA